MVKKAVQPGEAATPPRPSNGYEALVGKEAVA